MRVNAMPDNTDAAQADSALAELAKVIFACGKSGTTPVIVCGHAIVLMDEFYVALCHAVRKRSGCSVRLDILPGHRLSGMLSVIRRRSHLQRLNKRLMGTATVGSTLALSRTNHPTSEIVIGLAGPKDELPSYAKSIELAA
jgi:hypothetical protein